MVKTARYYPEQALSLTWSKSSLELSVPNQELWRSIRDHFHWQPEVSTTGIAPEVQQGVTVSSVQDDQSRYTAELQIPSNTGSAAESARNYLELSARFSVTSGSEDRSGIYGTCAWRLRDPEAVMSRLLDVKFMAPDMKPTIIVSSKIGVWTYDLGEYTVEPAVDPSILDAPEDRSGPPTVADTQASVQAKVSLTVDLVVPDSSGATEKFDQLISRGNKPVQDGESGPIIVVIRDADAEEHPEWDADEEESSQEED
jgi:hypothetical protein